MEEVLPGQLLFPTPLPPLPFSFCLWCTAGTPASWLASTGLHLDPRGFVQVDQCLRASCQGVFAAGDVHASLAYPREKAGVIAVRQGVPLYRNLRREALGKPLKPFRPQEKWLSLIRYR